MDCECKNWASEDARVVFLTGHHRECPKCPDPISASYNVIRDLVRAMEKWSDDEKGVHHEAWDAYVRAKQILLEPIDSERA
jgi:hypothetical protein